MSCARHVPTLAPASARAPRTPHRPRRAFRARFEGVGESADCTLARFAHCLRALARAQVALWRVSRTV
eukprot:6172244-Pleurochrysis_carterae.AAC.1